MSLHADARAVLASWVAPDPAQERLRRAYLDHLDRYPDAMWRSCLSGHLTASTAVVDSTGQRVLLTLHRKIRLWLQLGGHCEPGDSSLAAAALREATEESGSRASACSPLRCGWTGMRCRAVADRGIWMCSTWRLLRPAQNPWWMRLNRMVWLGSM